VQKAFAPLRYVVEVYVLNIVAYTSLSQEEDDGEIPALELNRSSMHSSEDAQSVSSHALPPAGAFPHCAWGKNFPSCCVR
jgi:hypothetical protein